MEVGVLGPTLVRRGDEAVDLGTRKQRGLLAALALYAGRPVPTDTIIELLWADDPPPTVTGTLQAYVSGLRRSLEPSRGRRAPSALLVTVGSGYALRIPPDQLDAARFVSAVNVQHQRLAPVSALVPQPTGRTRPDRETLESAVAELDAALALWRGEPYLELDDAADARAERTRLAELQLVATEDRALAGLWLGRQATVAAELEALTGAHPLRERLWGLRALALARAGRQADALDVLRQVREVLDDELGLEPGPELQALQTAVLRQDPALGWVAEAAAEREPAAVSASVAERRPRTPRPSGSPLVGRDVELAALRDELDAAEAGAVRFATLIGEPGIGKTRLATELIADATDRAAVVLTGRCSQDDGAPPLWPWSSVLRGLGADLPGRGSDELDVSQFAVWEQILQIVLTAARKRLVLMVLDDLHWADPATLRVLRLLAEGAETTDAGGPARLLVLATWRAHPEPTGALADLAEMVARRHGLRLELTGLTADQAATLVEGVAHTRPERAAAGRLRDRTDGNPFFLVEYARLAVERGGLEATLRDPDPPAAVSDVLTRRLQRLPETSRTLLRTAAVIGRQFDLDTLVGASAVGDDAALDALDAAAAAGLIREDGIDRFSFAHALVRDAAYAELSASRRARLHVRLAELLEHRPGRETERARHWAAAGPAYAARAWPAAIDAARLAARLHAHEQASALLADALVSMDADPEAGELDRYEALIALIDAYRWSAQWQPLIAAAEQAIAVADRLGDVRLLAQAATSPTIGVLWQSAPLGEVHTVIVDALRRSLAGLPTTDDPMRCRVMLSLANELYFGATFEERSALVEESLAMATRLGDRRLLLDAHQIAFPTLWCPATARDRLRHATESARLAEELGEELAFVVSATLRAVVLGELGEIEQMWTAIDVARAEARRLRVPFGEVVLDGLELPWRAMRGEFDLAEALLNDIARRAAVISVEQSGDAVGGAMVILRFWQGRAGEVAGDLEHMSEGLPLAAPAVLFRVRAGQLDEARAFYATHPVDLGGETWLSILTWASAAAIAPWVDDRKLAADSYARLAPYAGRAACAGSGTAIGPVDAYLAFAAAAVGEPALAARHAEDALGLMRRWQIPLAEAWFTQQQAELGF
ncbi:BTAD domain-containing putative transcriptional regulator [Microlunatus ginsengisoli]|uniref:BTAD domain-containing putative transcriptional regulator n=1 Tax=Microlunatus ginsengisoli TaxID=363863 RepID=A0ABP6ZN54_9ACTN